METEIKNLRRDVRTREEQIAARDGELQTLRQFRDTTNTDALISALANIKEKNAHLEKSLSAENRLKQDLFSALGEAKHQIDNLKSACCELLNPHMSMLFVGELKRKDDEMMALRMRLSGSPSHTPNGLTVTPPPPAPTMNNNNNGLMQSTMHSSHDNVDLLTSAIYNGVAAYL